MLSQETIAALIVSALGAAVVWGSTKSKVDAMRSEICELRTRFDKLDSDSRATEKQVAVLGQKVDGLIKSVDEGFQRLFKELGDLRSDHK